jgi:hypothetical protein
MERFDGVVESHGTGGGNVVEIPFDVKAVFGSGRPPVRGTVNGFPIRSRLVSMGGRYLLGLNREVRDGAGVAAGDRVSVGLELDEEPRVVEVPDDLTAALDDAPDARELFDRLSYTHRREYAEWITSAKRDDTRRGRVEKTIAMLREGVKHP